MKIKSLLIAGALLFIANEMTAQVQPARGPETAKTVTMVNSAISTQEVRFNTILDKIQNEENPETLAGLAQKTAGYMQFDIEDFAKTADMANETVAKKVQTKKDIYKGVMKMVGTADKPGTIVKTELVKLVGSYIKTL